MWASLIGFRGFCKSLKLHKEVLCESFFLGIPDTGLRTIALKKVNGGVLIVKHNSYKQGVKEGFGLGRH